MPLDTGPSFEAPPKSDTTKALDEVRNATEKALRLYEMDKKEKEREVEMLREANQDLMARNFQLQREIDRLMTTAMSHQGAVESELPERPQNLFRYLWEIPGEVPFHSVAITSDGEKNVSATASWDGVVRVREMDGTEIRSLGTSGGQKMGGLYDVAFAKNDANILGAASLDHNVYIWDWRTGTFGSILRGHRDEVNAIDFHQSKPVCCSASDDRRAIIWDCAVGCELRKLEQHTKEVYGATFLGQEHEFFVATCCFDQKTRVFDMRSKDVVQAFEGHQDDVIGVDYSSQKRLLVTGSDDGKIMLWDARKGWNVQAKLMEIITKRPEVSMDNEVKRVRFSTSGDMLAAGCSSGKVLLYDIDQVVKDPKGEIFQTLPSHSDCVFDVAWCTQPSGAKVLMTASHDNGAVAGLTRLQHNRPPSTPPV
eukprot:CAMPEP_0117515546 /NCGR_PEP_ID=MMETSP0784-20121206/30636_1 /TAXON_ID=39447 /ORGANISM="" /LENGTH=423 /DNA_ID=CAMNT_0005311367 /DNA_START=148 /DNA_END=1420 /DNA_ORIENTATION=-